MESKLPEFFKPLFWSCNYLDLDLNTNKKAILVNTLNYGDIHHWSWLKSYYGENGISEIIKKIPATELRDRVRPIIKLLFPSVEFNYAPRSTK